MKKILLLIAIATIALFACNDPKDPPDDSLPAQTDTPPPAPADTVAVKTVN